MSKNLKGNWTKVGPANKKRTSVKTSIPTFLVGKYTISVGDTLEWDIGDGFMTVKKIDVPDNGNEPKKPRRKPK